MIDFVAKSYEENRFDPDKVLRSVAERSSVAEPVEAHRRSKFFGRVSAPGHFGKLSDRKLSLRHIVTSVVSVAAAALVGIFLYTSWRTSWTSYTAYDIAPTFTLPDSSSVTLAPGATLRLQRHKDNRLVQMTGKIYFDVRHDDRTPFRIDAGSGFFKVLGTRFQVDAPVTPLPAPVAEHVEAHRRSGIPGHFGKLSDRGPDSISVSVVSGKVLFSAVRSGEEGLILTKGQSAVLRQGFSAPARVSPKHPNPAAWATGEFIYDNAPLPEVLSELSEYYGVTLALSDVGQSLDGLSDNAQGSGSDMEPRRLSGEFSTASLSDILSLINFALGISVEVE